MSFDESSEARFAAYVEALTGAIGHADRATPLRHYCTGLLMPAERKSVEPMAAMTAPARAAAQHQSLLHFVGQAPWSDAAVLTKVRDLVLPAIERAGPIEAWIIDDTGFPKKGRHSVGVARQYCGQLGKQDNCQVAVTLSLANRTASLPVAYRLYLPQEWADDPARRQKCARRHLPDQAEIALDRSVRLPKPACHAGHPHGRRLWQGRAAAPTSRAQVPLCRRDLSNTSVWAQGATRAAAKPW
jgi:SRSO17 transposase